MTPQKARLNQDAWATLEGWVRDWSGKADTLYVVTGADIKGANTYATDNSGVKCLVPSGYYKALLAYDKGSFNKTGGYSAIAFYFDHKSYADSQIMSQKMSIDALEQKLGIDFFVNLPDKIGGVFGDKG